VAAGRRFRLASPATANALGGLVLVLVGVTSHPVLVQPPVPRLPRRRSDRPHLGSTIRLDPVAHPGWDPRAHGHHLAHRSGRHRTFHPAHIAYRVSSLEFCVETSTAVSRKLGPKYPRQPRRRQQTAGQNQAAPVLPETVNTTHPRSRFTGNTYTLHVPDYKPVIKKRQGLLGRKCVLLDLRRKFDRHAFEQLTCHSYAVCVLREIDVFAEVNN
jgi:hypothetical protein